MNRRRRAMSRSGVTLVEAIVAVVILAAAVPATLWAIRDASVQRVAPLQASKARWLLTEKLEDIIADRHATGRGYGYLVAANYPAEASITGYPGFTRTTSIAETGADLASAGTGYKRVTVRVAWRDARGVDRQVDMATVLTDY